MLHLMALAALLVAVFLFFESFNRLVSQERDLSTKCADRHRKAFFTTKEENFLSFVLRSLDTFHRTYMEPFVANLGRHRI